MPWLESHSLISSDHRDPSTCDSNSIRTVVISEADGIQAIVGKPVGTSSAVTLSYLFAKYKGWTMQKAQDWFKENEHTSEVPPGYFPPTVAAGRRFDPRQSTVGDLVGVKLGVSQRQCPDSACARMHARTNTPCLEVRACDIVSSMNQNGSGHFDPMRPTVGDLVGKTAEAAATIEENSLARFDPSRPTIGSLVGVKLPSMGLSGMRGGASGVVVALHPRGIKEVSR